VIIPNFRADGHDSDFFLDMISPTPFLLAYGKEDSSHQMISQHAELETLAFDGGHELPEDVRESVYSFITSHLC
jgi:predicted esterase